MNIQMQTEGVFSAPLVVTARINFLKVVTKFCVILLTMPEINVVFACDYENGKCTSVLATPGKVMKTSSRKKHPIL